MEGGEKEERKKRKKTDALKHPTIQQKDMKTNKCTGTTQRDGMGREKGGGFRMGSTCIPVADSF